MSKSATKSDVPKFAYEKDLLSPSGTEPKLLRRDLPEWKTFKGA